jgi:hypothetical protein
MSPSRFGEYEIPMTCLEDGSVLGRFETLIGAVIVVSGTRLIVPCLVPLVLRSIRTIMEATGERKTAAYVMTLWKYNPLNQDDVL